METPSSMQTPFPMLLDMSAPGVLTIWNQTHKENNNNNNNHKLTTTTCTIRNPYHAELSKLIYFSELGEGREAGENSGMVLLVKLGTKSIQNRESSQNCPATHTTHQQMHSGGRGAGAGGGGPMFHFFDFSIFSIFRFSDFSIYSIYRFFDLSIYRFIFI